MLLRAWPLRPRPSGDSAHGPEAVFVLLNVAHRGGPAGKAGVRCWASICRQPGVSIVGPQQSEWTSLCRLGSRTSRS